MAGEREGPGHRLAWESAEDSIRRGLSAHRRGETAAAADALDEALPYLSDETPELWQRLGEAFLVTGDFARALDAFERVVSAGRATPETLGRLAQAAAELGRPADEVRYREAAIDLAPADPALWTALGAAHRRTGDSAAALAAFAEAVRLDPMDPAGAVLELGRALREHGETERAISVYRDALKRLPERSDIWAELASSYSDLERFAESDQAVREAIRLSPGNAAAWHTIATNTLKQGKRDSAQKAYRRLTELNPEFADSIRTWVSSTAGLPPDAVDDADPAAPPPARRRGRLLSFRGRP